MSIVVRSVITEMDFVPYEHATVGSREPDSLHGTSVLDFSHGNAVVPVEKRRNSIRLQLGNLLRKITRSSFTSQPSAATNEEQTPKSLGSNRLLLLAEVRSLTDLTFTYSNMCILPPPEKNAADYFCPGSPITQFTSSDACNLSATSGFCHGNIEYNAIEATYRGNLSESVARLGRFHKDSIKCMEDLASYLQSNGDWLLAESCYHDCLEAREMICGYESIEAIRIVGKLACVLRLLRKPEEARMCYKRALDIRAKVQGNEHVSTLKTAHNLALVLEEMGDLNEAEKYHIQATLGFENILGSTDLNTIKATDNLARIFRMQMKFNESESLYLRLLRSKLEIYGENNEETLGTLVTLATVLEDLGKIKVAGAFYRCAMIGYSFVLGAKHDRIGRIFAAYCDMAVKDSVSQEEADSFHEEILSCPPGTPPPPRYLSQLLECTTAQR